MSVYEHNFAHSIVGVFPASISPLSLLWFPFSPHSLWASGEMTSETAPEVGLAGQSVISSPYQSPAQKSRHHCGAFHCPAYRDWFRNGHITQLRPIRMKESLLRASEKEVSLLFKREPSEPACLVLNIALCRPEAWNWSCLLPLRMKPQITKGHNWSASDISTLIHSYNWTLSVTWPKKPPFFFTADCAGISASGGRKYGTWYTPKALLEF